jgi:hypothetical protein
MTYPCCVSAARIMCNMLRVREFGFRWDADLDDVELTWRAGSEGHDLSCPWMNE